jgi:hypothetical protein
MTAPIAQTPLATLGEVFHFRGAGPRRCATCGAVFLALGRENNRRWCDRCQAAAPYRQKGQPKPCRGGCGTILQGKISFCSTCREHECLTCGRLGGAHTPSCSMAILRACRGCGGKLTAEDRHRRRARCHACRPGVVSEDDLAEMYVAWRVLALRVAVGLVGRAEAEDCVSDAMLSLLNGREGLRYSPTQALLIRAVKWQAWQRQSSPWFRRVVSMSGLQLELVEKYAEAARRGWPARPAESPHE